MKLEISNRKISGKSSNICKLKNTPIKKNPWVKKEITGEIRK